MDCHPPPSFPASDEDEPPRETREDSDQDLPVGDGDITSHTISPLTSSQDPSRLFRRLESGGRPRLARVVVVVAAAAFRRFSLAVRS